MEAQLVPGSPCLSWALYAIGMALGTLEVSPSLYDCGQWTGRIPVELRGTDLMCGSRVPRLESMEARNVGIEV